MEHQSQAPVPVEKEPRHHPVFREGPIRILDVQIPPGDVTLYHTHDEAILYIPISISPTDTQILGQEWLGVGPTDRSRFTGLVVATDTSYATKPLTHRVKNVGDKLFRLIAITNSATPAAESRHPLPGTTVNSSTWYTASQLTLPSGETSGWQTALAPLVIVQPAEGHARVEREGNQGPMELDQPGAWSFIAKGTRYRVSNAGPVAVAVVVVEPRQ
jgi:quercetin dioxygenase-like cupin family protein